MSHWVNQIRKLGTISISPHRKKDFKVEEKEIKWMKKQLRLK